MISHPFMMKEPHSPKRGLHRRDLLKSAAAAGMGLMAGIIVVPLGVRKFTLMFADIWTPILRTSLFRQIAVLLEI